MIVLVIIGSFVATLAIGILCHELAHAAAAWMMGRRIRGIRIGFGPLLLETRIGAAPLEIRLVPGLGMVELHPTLHWRRMSDFVVVAAGPASDIVLLVAICVIGEYLPSTGSTFAVIGPALCAQVFAVAGSLLPRSVEVFGARLPNDGLQMLLLLFARTGRNPHRERYEAVLRRYLPPGRALPPFSSRSEEISCRIAAIVARRERITPTTVASLESLLSPDLPACEHVAILDTLVTSLLPRSDAKRLADLDRWSSKAFALAPEIATLRGSRGSVLIEIGRAAEGLDLLADAETGSDYNDCLVCAYRALGHFKLGESGRADAAFARTMALFRHEAWNGQDAASIVSRIGRTIGSVQKSPSTWSIEAARASVRTRTSARPAPQGTL